MASLADALVRQLLDGRHIASLATENPNSSIHMVAVWYWFDGTHVYVATSSRSRKARNLSRGQSRVPITAAALTCGSYVSPHNPICWAVRWAGEPWL